MGLYIYSHPKTGKTIEIVQGMNDVHEYIDEKGVKWQREFTAPNATIDGNIDPNNVNAFVEKTGKSKDTVGNLWQRSKELSEKRARVYGEDPLQKKYFEDYAQKRRGKRNPNEKKFKNYEI